MRFQFVEEGGQRHGNTQILIPCARDLMRWKANGIDAKGQCGKNWPSSCDCSMCLMCSDITLVEINYLGRSEGVSREIPVSRHELCSDTSSTFSVCLGFLSISVLFYL